MDTLLIVDDDNLIRRFLKEYLEDQGYLVIEATNGKRMVDIVNQHNIDLVLLDYHLPDGDSSNYIPSVREQTNAPLIMISGNGECSCKVECLECGADDYIQKPIDMTELNARIMANIRRYKGEYDGVAPANDSDNICFFHDLKLDRNLYQVFDNDNESCELTAREFALLDVLVKNKNKAMRREELCESLREEKYLPTPRTIDVKITRIRKKIKDDAANPHILITVRGVGYMFNHK